MQVESYNCLLCVYFIVFFFKDSTFNYGVLILLYFFIFQEQAIRSGGGKSYDSVSNNDRDGYGQPDGNAFLFFFCKEKFLIITT